MEVRNGNGRKVKDILKVRTCPWILAKAVVGGLSV
jgi:hypothetical protein